MTTAGLLLTFFVGLSAATTAAQGASTTFRDCPNCPQMVEIPIGRLTVPTAQDGAAGGEGTTRDIVFARPFAVGKYEVTFAEWDACVLAGGCGGLKADDNGWGRGARPVIFVNWAEARGYAQWLTRTTGKPYRLLTDAEWEYAARGGAATAYWWGDDIGRNRANCKTCGSFWDDRQTAPVGSFAANPFGLHDMHGNVTEWVEDCADGPDERPADGSARPGDCPNGARNLRGGSWSDPPAHLRLSYRSGDFDSYNAPETGFRVARDLP